MNDLIKTLYDNLPKEYVDLNLQKSGESGEELAVDEACVWKRVLDYRLIKKFKPKNILETHAGLGVATDLYKLASPKSSIVSCKHFQTDIPKNMIFDYIDIDPFGQPYEALEHTLIKHSDVNTIWQITNGEIMQVSRNLKGVKLKSEYTGKDCYKWAEEVYIPWMEEYLDLKCQYYYIFPTSVRAVFSNKKISRELFKGCPVYMGWITKYKDNNRRYLF